MAMRRVRGRTAPLLPAVAAGWLIAANAGTVRAQGCDFTISLPSPQTTTYTISASGTYCLTTDVTMDASFTSGNAIEIAASRVVLDLDGHTIDGGAAGTATQARGIHANRQSLLTIRDGTVRGFYIGLYLEDSTYSTSLGNRVEGMRFEGHLATAIWAQGMGTVVRSNHVLKTGGISTGQSFDVYAVRAEGANAHVIDNDLIETSNLVSSAVTAGIQLFVAPGSVVADNRVTNRVSASATSPSQGIRTLQSSSILLLNNQIVGWPAGIYTSPYPPLPKCRGNLFNNVSSLLLGCLDVANNN
jgi:nitrous oxidase accessory protein NosD